MSRGVAFVALVAACVLGAGGYVAWAATRTDDVGRTADAASLRALERRPYVVFLSSAKGVAPFDRLSVAPLDDPAKRLEVGLRCDRVATVASLGSCVEHDVGLGVTYHVTFFDRAFRPVARGYGAGIPSRTRLSPSGRFAAVTSFSQGDSYLHAGEFSTTTAVFRTATGKAVVSSLEQLHVLRDGKRFEPLDRNFWGITFVDDRRFYATMGTGETTYLVLGDLAMRTLRTVHENVECPSLAPDGRRIGFKRRDAHGAWRFTVLDVATLRETPLAERRSVDDQLAWAGDDRVAYGWQGAVWTERADGAGKPTLLLDDAQSPTFVYPSLT